LLIEQILAALAAGDVELQGRGHTALARAWQALETIGHTEIPNHETPMPLLVRDPRGRSLGVENTQRGGRVRSSRNTNKLGWRLLVGPLPAGTFHVDFEGGTTEPTVGMLPRARLVMPDPDGGPGLTFVVGRVEVSQAHSADQSDG
jgi:hypothetical protein